MVCVALVQTKITSTQENFQRIIRYLDKAVEQKADIVIFPEFALQSYTAPEDQPTSEMLSPLLEKIGEKCKDGSIYAIVPAVIKEDSERFNRSFLINRTGTIQYVYTKQCLFWKEKEMAKASQGTSNAVIETDFGKIGILQCYDVYSPNRLEYARPLVEDGARVIFVPSDSVHYDYPGKNNEDDVRNAPPTLAKELKVYVVICDTYRPKLENADPGDLKNEYSLCFSRFIAPDGHTISSIKDKEGMILERIEL